VEFRRRKLRVERESGSCVFLKILKSERRGFIYFKGFYTNNLKISFVKHSNVQKPYFINIILNLIFYIIKLMVHFKISYNKKCEFGVPKF